MESVKVDRLSNLASQKNTEISVYPPSGYILKEHLLAGKLFELSGNHLRGTSTETCISYLTYPFQYNLSFNQDQVAYQNSNPRLKSSDIEGTGSRGIPLSISRNVSATLTNFFSCHFMNF